MTARKNYITNTFTIELCFVSKWDVTMQLVMGIEPAAKFQHLSKIAPGSGCLAILQVRALAHAPPCKQCVLANRHVD